MATHIDIEGVQVPLNEARASMTKAAKEIKNLTVAGRKATVKAAWALYAVKASGLYLASLSAADLRKNPKGGRATAWSRFCDSAGVSETERSRMISRIEITLRLAEAGVPRAKVDGLPADVVKTLGKVAGGIGGDADYARAADALKTLEGQKLTPTAKALAAFAESKGYNAPTDKVVTVAAVVSAISKMIASDRPIAVGSVSLPELNEAIATLLRVRDELAERYARAEAEADMAEDEDEDEDELN